MDLLVKPITNNNTVHYTPSMEKLIGFNRKVFGDCDDPPGPPRKLPTDYRISTIHADQDVSISVTIPEPMLNQSTRTIKSDKAATTSSNATSDVDVGEISADLLRNVLYGRWCGPSSGHPRTDIPIPGKKNFFLCHLYNNNNNNNNNN